MYELKGGNKPTPDNSAQGGDLVLTKPQMIGEKKIGLSSRI